jgi:hypothetical protein
MSFMPYLANLREICGNAFDPAFCLVACFLLIAFGIWSLMSIAHNRHRANALSAAVFGVALVAVALPGVVFSEAWITCSLSDSASRTAGLAPAAAFHRASVAPRRRVI